MAGPIAPCHHVCWEDRPLLLRTIVAVGGFTVLHYLAALLGDNLIFPGTPVSVFWPARASC